MKNKKTRGKGKLSQAAEASLADDKQYKQLTAPIREEERGTFVPNVEVGNAFFAKRIIAKKKTPPPTIAMETNRVPAKQLCEAVTALVKDAAFSDRHKNKGAPLAMIAFAKTVMEKIVLPKNDALFRSHFNGLAITVPDYECCLEPHYHSIIGQKLLLVDWIRVYGADIPCPDRQCNGRLHNTRTNFSKSKLYFQSSTLKVLQLGVWCR